MIKHLSLRGAGGIRIKMIVADDKATIILNKGKENLRSIDLRIVTSNQVMTDFNIDIESSIIHYKGRVRHPCDLNAQMSWFNDDGDGLINCRLDNKLILIPIVGFNTIPGS